MILGTYYCSKVEIMLKQNRIHEDNHYWDSSQYVSEWIEKIESQPPRLALKRIQRYQNALREFSVFSELPVRILDLGVGWGDLTKEIFVSFPKAEVVGLDNSLVMLEKARENLFPWGNSVDLRKADLTVADALNGLGLFDGIISSSSLHHLNRSQLSSLFKQVANHLKPHGRFVNVDMFHQSTRLKTRFMWRLVEIAMRFQMLKGPAGFLERIAFDCQSREFLDLSVFRKPSLSEYLALLDLQGMKSHWRRADHRFIVVATLKS